MNQIRESYYFRNTLNNTKIDKNKANNNKSMKQRQRDKFMNRTQRNKFIERLKDSVFKDKPLEEQG